MDKQLNEAATAVAQCRIRRTRQQQQNKNLPWREEIDDDDNGKEEDAIHHWLVKRKEKKEPRDDVAVARILRSFGPRLKSCTYKHTQTELRIINEALPPSLSLLCYPFISSPSAAALPCAHREFGGQPTYAPTLS